MSERSENIPNSEQQSVSKDPHPRAYIKKLQAKRTDAEGLLEALTTKHLEEHPDTPPPLTLDLMSKTGYSYPGLGDMYDQLRKENHPDWPIRPKKGRRSRKDKER